MDVFQDWPHRWFGFWRDNYADGAQWPTTRFPSIEKFPYIDSFADRDFSYGSELQNILNYLTRGRYLWLTSEGACDFRDCKHDRGVTASATPMTDGTWIWSGNLSHYVVAHSVRLPDSFYAHLRSAQFKLPKPFPILTRDLKMSLDWPFLPAPIAKAWDLPHQP